MFKKLNQFSMIALVLGSLFYSAPVVAQDEPFSDDAEQTSQPSRANTRKSSDPMAGNFSVSPAIGFGSGYVAAGLTISYYYNSYVVFDLSGHYLTAKDDSTDVETVQYGPEFDLRLQLPNPTMFTPFVGAGPGYEKWTIKYKNEIFDDNESLTGNAFLGVDVAFTRHFSLIVMTKTTYYVTDPPLDYPHKNRHEPKSYNRVSVGFAVKI